MRIVAGRFRGRIIKAPAGDTTRPTTDRVRESVFSAVSSYVGFDLGGGTALDAFAGSGALGLEALSRGCSHVVFAETDRSALAAIRSNVATLDACAQTSIVAGDVFEHAALGRLPRAPYSLLLLDPPYRLDAATVASLLTNLTMNAQLADGAVVMWEHASAGSIEWPEEFSAISSKRYGSTQVDVGVYERGA